MNKSTNCGEKINMPYRRIPNNLCRYFALKGVKHNSSLLKCGLFREKHSIIKKGEKEHSIKNQKKLTSW